jgi:NADPH:quinone reductase-like Zn-dependent oxidoreductase
VQLAKHWGAEVTGVSSASNHELVKSLGAERMIDYKTEDFTQSGETYDVIFDAVRKISSSKSKDVLKETGSFLSTSTSTKESRENLVFLRSLIQAGDMKAVIDKTFTLDEIVEAHRHVDTGRKKGNVVVMMKHN